MPLSEELQRACEALGRALASSEPVREYLEAQARLEADPEARALEEEFQALYQSLLARQQAGEDLPREEVDRFYRLRNQAESHPLIVERDIALSELKQYFADVAFQISTLLGADYTALARRV
ncbi:MAG: YlbF family regulator [Thermoflexales bacterium]|nr:YlbF family regulator [Thermoflexales bacterium]